MITAKQNKLSSLLKYPGGKEKELKHILPSIPEDTNNYYEPFAGGGAVYFAIDAERYFINDKSAELISLYQMIKDQNMEFFDKITAINISWDELSRLAEKHIEELEKIYIDYRAEKIKKEKEFPKVITEFVNHYSAEFNRLLTPVDKNAAENFTNELIKSLKNKLSRMKTLEEKKGRMPEEDLDKNIECAIKNAFYMHFRYLYNNIEELKLSRPFATAIYFFIREYCYSSMFRYNKAGKFNVPYGGISYNRKSMSRKIEYFSDEKLISQLKNTEIYNTDFEQFMSFCIPQKDDFIFLDPPYDTQFSTYAGNEFGQEDQRRLADFLINKSDAKFMLVIKNTEFILSLYPHGMETKNHGKINVRMFDKRYMVSFQDRNDKKAQHLLITNY